MQQRAMGGLLVLLALPVAFAAATSVPGTASAIASAVAPATAVTGCPDKLADNYDAAARPQHREQLPARCVQAARRACRSCASSSIE